MILDIYRKPNDNITIWSCYNRNTSELICEIKNISNQYESDEYAFENKTQYGSEVFFYSLLSERAKKLKQNLTTFEKPQAHFILDNFGNSIGSIVVKNNKIKGRLLASYYSYVFRYKNKIYEAYEVGFGKKKQYFVIYENGNIIATIEYNTNKEPGSPSYSIYAIEDRYELIYFMEHWWFNRCYLPKGQENRGHFVVTPQKELKEKYNPDFITKIINNHNHDI